MFEKRSTISQYTQEKKISVLYLHCLQVATWPGPSHLSPELSHLRAFEQAHPAVQDVLPHSSSGCLPSHPWFSDYTPFPEPHTKVGHLILLTPSVLTTSHCVHSWCLNLGSLISIYFLSICHLYQTVNSIIGRLCLNTF